MSKALNSSSAMTSNALAILPSLGRRLLSEDEGERGQFPSWVGNDKRKLLALSMADIKPDVTVAQDGSGKYKTITQALGAVPKKGNATFMIYIKEGVYKENVMVERSMTNVMMLGDGPTKTKITGSLNYVDGTPTFKTATLAVVGDGFIGKNLGVENTAGAAKHQAVALLVQSDKSTTTRSYLGRPWKEYSRTIIMQSRIDGLINQEGWLPWGGDFGLTTCFYSEIGNRGPGAATTKRVTWKGYKKVDLAHAQKYTVKQFIQGKTWLPKTGVPFTPGLM
ncbi:pectinesterase [Musa troglodytarum]|uniref:Pectinesterase n=1 Tax=Musa troglodytarum TaxID=320322 RepID=A0A9E7ER67_9LILI|nr:pectinesterase [Musa troglodytarum]